MERITNFIWDFLANRFNQMLMDIYTAVLSWATQATGEFWNEATIISLVKLSVWVSRGVFFASIVIVFFDTFEDMAGGKSVYLPIFAGNIIKGMAFAEVAPYLGVYAMRLSETLVGQINLSESLSGVTLTTMPNFGMVSGTTFSTLLVLIACIAFLVMALKRFGTMLIQILTCVFYVPSITRGDTTAMGSWLRQTIAIAVTFFLQYLIFYLGLYFWLSANLLISIGLWLSMGMVSRILDKYGLSSGTGGAMATVGSAVQSVAVLAR